MTSSIRLIVGLLLLVLGLALDQARADTPSDGVAAVTSDLFNFNGQYGPAPGDSVCASLQAADDAPFANDVYPQTYQLHFVSTGTHAGQCSGTQTYRGNVSPVGDAVLTYVGQGSDCSGVPNSSVASNPSGGSYCKCSSGYQVSGGSCVTAAAACSAVAAGATGTYYASAGGGGLNLCVQGCTLTGSVSGTDSSGTYFGGPFTSTGGTCGGGSGSGPATSTPTPTPLIPGNCPGTVNGVAVPGGVPCTSTTSGSGTSTTPGPTTTASAPAGASNGTSSNSTTTCTGGTCTTTTTTSTTTGVGSSGGGTTTTGTSTTTQGQGAFCQANPSDPQCSSASAFGGSCSGGFTCKGDAVACATAKIEYESACLFNASPSSTTASKYTSLSSQSGQGATGSFTDSQSIANALPLAPAAGAGLSDMSVAFGSGANAMTLSVPLGTYLNPHLAVIRGVVIAFGYVMFVLIVFVRK